MSFREKTINSHSNEKINGLNKMWIERFFSHKINIDFQTYNSWFLTRIRDLLELCAENVVQCIKFSILYKHCKMYIVPWFIVLSNFSARAVCDDSDSATVTYSPCSRLLCMMVWPENIYATRAVYLYMYIYLNE